MSKLKKLFCAVLLMTGVVGGVVAPTPVSADALVVGTGVLAAADFTISIPNGVLIVEIHGKAQFVAGTMVVEFQCEATALGAVASTGITACNVDDISGIPVPNNLPGAYSTAAGAGTYQSSGGAPYGCVAGKATWILGGSSSASACGAFIWAAT